MITEVVDFRSKDYYQAVAVRDKVLRQPLNLQFDPVQLATEVSDLHIVTKIGRQVVGTMIMSASNGKAKMRQVAVLSEFQSVGVGMNMVNFFEQLSKSLELNAVVLHARETAVSFYKKLGYTKEGNVFEEVGIPHWKMTKPL
jgi:predicted GNAT family N-acyltransferase